MAKEMRVSEVNEFLEGPLVTWFSSCLEPPLNAEKLTYEEVIDGVLIHRVFLQMDLHCQEGDVVPPAGEASLRARNLKRILGNVRLFYEEELNHAVIRLPDVSRLSREPHLHVSEARLLLKLLLGCAVNCPRNERVIENIHKLNEKTKIAIAEHIMQVLHFPGITLSQEMLQVPSETNSNAEIFETVRHVCSARDYYYEISRKQQDELIKKDKDLREARYEIIEMRKEKGRLVSELIRSAKKYRNELDAANEKAERAGRLEQEIARFKEKLAKVDSYKSSMKELREKYRLLAESKKNLHEQLDTYKLKANNRIMELQQQICLLNHSLEELSLENEISHDKFLELCKAKDQLEKFVEARAKETHNNRSIMDSYDTSIDINNSLFEQLNCSTKLQRLKLELENRRLSNLPDSMKRRSFSLKRSIDESEQ